MNVTIRDLMTDPHLFGNQFGDESWLAWRALLAGFFGLELTAEELQIFQSLTNRATSPQEACEELWLVVGRRGGKSNAAALLAVLLACFYNYQPRLSPGEIATVACLASDRKQAQVIHRYTSGLLNENPMLRRLIVAETKETITLNNRVVIEVGTASFRATRGYTYAAVICDEIAFWRSDESANPDTEILNALRPGLATLAGKLFGLSSPYSKRGELWDTYRRYFGKDGDILVAQAASRTMNPKLPQKVVDRALEKDPAAAAAEWLGQFRSDIEAFIPREIIDRATRLGPRDLPPEMRISYFAFVDPAGGGQDEFTMAIGHRESKRVIVDVLRARRGTPADIVKEYSDLLKEYRVRKAISDKYAGSWPADEFDRHGIKVEQSAKPKSDLYKDALAAFNSDQVEIPPDDKLVNQLIGLERRTARGGRDSIDHAPGGHDDRANAIAGLVATNNIHSGYDLSAALGEGAMPGENPYKNFI